MDQLQQFTTDKHTRQNFQLYQYVLKIMRWSALAIIVVLLALGFALL